MTRVLVVDDHVFFRKVLTDLLNAAEDLEVVGECSDGTEVVAAVQTLHPDVVLMDLRMKHMSGIDAASLLKTHGSNAQVIMLSSETAPGTHAAARSSGAAGFVRKGANPHQVIQAIRQVASGGTAWPETAELSLGLATGQVRRPSWGLAPRSSGRG